MPDSVAAAVAEYRESEDDLGDFIADCTRDAGAGHKEPKDAVFQAYAGWAGQNGITRPWTAKQFTRRLSERAGWQLDPGRRSWMAKSITTSGQT